MFDKIINFLLEDPISKTVIGSIIGLIAFEYKRVVKRREDTVQRQRELVSKVVDEVHLLSSAIEQSNIRSEFMLSTINKNTDEIKELRSEIRTFILPSHEKFRVISRKGEE